jgi:serine/threonine protein kinase
VGACRWRDVLEIVAPTCAALAAAHAQNIVHRDLKASNVFLARGADGASAWC